MTAPRLDPAGRTAVATPGAVVPRTRPILVTGSHRSGTGWVGRVLSMSPTPIGYVWEPFSPIHRPGTFAHRFPWWYPYICDHNAAGIADPIEDMLAFRYRPGAELRSCRTPKDAGRMVRDWWRFDRNHRDHAVPLLKDPIALYSAGWLADTFDMDVVVLIRHPAAFAASAKRINRSWASRMGTLLDQPLLMRDLLADYEEPLRRAVASEPEIVDQAILLWNMLNEAVSRYQATRPEWVVSRIEEFAREPVERFRDLYARLDLVYDRRVQEFVRATSDAANPAEATGMDSVYRDSATHMWNWTRRLTAEEVTRVRRGTERLASQFYTDDDW
jgi:hypothetical protein